LRDSASCVRRAGSGFRNGANVIGTGRF